VSLLDDIQKSVYDGKTAPALELVKKALEAGLNAQDILNKALIPGIRDCGAGYEKGDKFIPEMLLSAKAMKQSIELLKPHLAAGGEMETGKVVMATVEGDVHDIGLELVTVMLESAGFKVRFMGGDVATPDIIAAVQEFKPHLLGLSALLTNTMEAMPKVIKILEEKGLRSSVKVMVGGAPVKQDFCDEIGADGYAYDAAAAVPMALKLRKSMGG
jgi:5-methyltetrahydrofolate--homocysteine methyltransferase